MAGADINLLDGQSRSPLFYAVSRGRCNVIATLLKANGRMDTYQVYVSFYGLLGQVVQIPSLCLSSHVPVHLCWCHIHRKFHVGTIAKPLFNITIEILLVHPHEDSASFCSTQRVNAVPRVTSHMELHVHVYIYTDGDLLNCLCLVCLISC